MKSQSGTYLPQNDTAYQEFETYIKDQVAKIKDQPIFRTDANNLFPLFLLCLPMSDRQHYNCHCCRKFVERYGGLVYANGSSVLWADWPNVPEYFRHAANELNDIVHHSTIVGPFVNVEAVWGYPRTEAWTHMHGFPEHRDVNQGAAEGEIRTGKELLETIRREVSREVIDTVVEVLERRVVPMSDKFVENARWLKGIIHLKNPNLWYYAATAPAGWCHALSAGMIGTLIRDVQSGKSAATIVAAFTEKVRGDRYQRSTKELTDGMIDAAEKVMAQYADSLPRRYVRREEVPCFWLPDVGGTKGGLFSTLRPIEKPLIAGNMPSTRITVARFIRDVLPTAKKLEYHVTSSLCNYYAMTGPVNERAENIIKWGNPYSWYTYTGGSTCGQWGLSIGWTPVLGVHDGPETWGRDGEINRLGFLLGCRDVHGGIGGGLFSENLRSEFHSIRAVVDQHYKVAPVVSVEGPLACGIMRGKDDPRDWLVRVDGTWTYIIDRWE